jgi:predicted nucleic acid-binding Zn ribbon protein
MSRSNRRNERRFTIVWMAAVVGIAVATMLQGNTPVS